MKAVVYEAPRDFSVRETPLPEPAAGEVRVALAATGICGTDVHIHDGDFFARFPLVPGHEPFGIVDALGEGVEGLEVGERVAVNGNSGCGRCSFCQEGRPLLCRRLEALGVTGPGGFAEHMVAPAGQCLPIGDLPDDAAVMVEPTACAIHGLDRIDVRPGSHALVLGAGPSGLVLAQLLAHGGATHVTVGAPTRFKLERAEAFGIDETVVLDRDDPEGNLALLRERADEGFDVVVEATGSAAVSRLCVRLARDGGTILQYGVTRPEDRIDVSPYDVYRRELTIRGSFAQVDCFPRSIAALRGGRVRTEGIVTHRFGLGRFGDALEAVRSDPDCLKAVVEIA